MMMRKQSGLTLVSVVFLVIVILSVVMLVVKIAPAYFEYFSVKRAFLAVKTEMQTSSMSKRDIINAFERQKTVDYFTSVGGDDLVIKRIADGGHKVSLDYSVVTPLIGNLSAKMDFSLTTHATGIN